MQRLVEVAEDESGAFLVCCGAIHAVPGVLIFFIIDFACVIASVIVYAIFVFNFPAWTNLIPLSALSVSLIVYLVGPLGFALQKLLFLQVYKLRLKATALWSIFWMFMILFFRNSVNEMVVAFVWLIAAVLYLIGGCFITKFIDFMLDYKGYDGADPAVMNSVSNKLVETSEIPGTITTTTKINA